MYKRYGLRLVHLVLLSCLLLAGAFACKAGPGRSSTPESAAVEKAEAALPPFDDGLKTVADLPPRYQYTDEEWAKLMADNKIEKDHEVDTSKVKPVSCPKSTYVFLYSGLLLVQPFYFEATETRGFINGYPVVPEKTARKFIAHNYYATEEYRKGEEIFAKRWEARRPCDEERLNVMAKISPSIAAGNKRIKMGETESTIISWVSDELRKTDLQINKIEIKNNNVEITVRSKIGCGDIKSPISMATPRYEDSNGVDNKKSALKSPYMDLMNSWAEEVKKTCGRNKLTIAGAGSGYSTKTGQDVKTTIKKIEYIFKHSSDARIAYFRLFKTKEMYIGEDTALMIMANKELFLRNCRMMEIN